MVLKTLSDTAFLRSKGYFSVPILKGNGKITVATSNEADTTAPAPLGGRGGVGRVVSLECLGQTKSRRRGARRPSRRTGARRLAGWWVGCGVLVGSARDKPSQGGGEPVGHQGGREPVGLQGGGWAVGCLSGVPGTNQVKAEGSP